MSHPTILKSIELFLGSEAKVFSVKGLQALTEAFERQVDKARQDILRRWVNHFQYQKFDFQEVLDASLSLLGSENSVYGKLYEQDEEKFKEIMGHVEKALLAAINKSSSIKELRIWYESIESDSFVFSIQQNVMTAICDRVTELLEKVKSVSDAMELMDESVKEDGAIAEIFKTRIHQLLEALIAVNDSHKFVALSHLIPEIDDFVPGNKSEEILEILQELSQEEEDVSLLQMWWNHSSDVGRGIAEERLCKLGSPVFY